MLITLKATFTRVYKAIVVSILCLLSLSTSATGLTPEAVLGDYWLDPIFGEAAAEQSVVIDVGNVVFSPTIITVKPESNIRFVFTNSSQHSHLMVISDDLGAIEEDSSFIDSYLEHGTDEISVPGGHSHADSNTTPQDASPMVKDASERPAVFLRSGETKEILIRFIDNSEISIGCILDQHYQRGMLGTINARPSW